MAEPVDIAARRQALDVEGSYIVQAPAGSGKTELLTQRYLALLAIVDRPEEILAITFTRKAAGQMRDRILAALELATGAAPAEAHEAETWRLARAARSRDRQCGWGVMESPSRLKVLTIDAFHAVLSRQLPVLSGAGGGLAIADRPEQLYREAARRTLEAAGEQDHDGAAARDLLAHVDNRFERAEDMLVNLLARRDQWLRRVGDPFSLDDPQRRAWLEDSIRRQIESVLATLESACPPHLIAELPSLIHHAARNLDARGADSAIRAWAGPATWPAPASHTVPRWQGMAELLLVSNGDWRKTVTVAQGFPAGDDRKKDMLDLLESLRGETRLRELLAEVRLLPDHRYDDGQWQVLGQILRLLVRCAAELEVVIRQRGQSDYVAVAASARQALLSNGEPTDLALALDYRIRHLLVDEFQDTSATQLELLHRLTAGWEAGDGRSVFFVGDPMQSIYGFREAEVGLFLDIRRAGRINEVPVDSLALQVNFRSSEGVVDWVNRTFAAVMPAYEDPRLGAVSFSRASAWQGADGLTPVRFHAFEEDDGVLEAERVRSVVADLRQKDPDARIAILVRSRDHLRLIAPRLKSSGLRFQAVEIERLLARPVVQDLMALARAISHPADRTAWLATLRAPWCGLTLDDLETLAGDGRESIWGLTRDPDAVENLSEDGRARLRRYAAVMAATLAEQGRRSLHRRVEGAWLALGGAAALEDPSAVDDATSFFHTLRSLQTGYELDDPAALESALQSLFGAPDPLADGGLQLMTIHKAKGLEFDYVLLPGLHRATGRGSPQLLHWLEVPRADGASDLLLATIEERGADKDPLHVFLKRQEDKKAAYELGRLLYVAATRARRQLHLFTSMTFSDGPGERRVRKPVRGTFLDLLWDSCRDDILAALEAAPGNPRADAPDDGRRPCIRRLPRVWRTPESPASVDWTPPSKSAETGDTSIEFSWAGRTSRAVGRVVHRWLERIAVEGVTEWPSERVEEAGDSVRRLLAEEGLESTAVPEAADKVLRALGTMLSDERGRWILSSAHREAHSEYALAGLEEGSIVHGVIDRFLVDGEGVAWVIDYKTGEHTGGDLEGFLDREMDRYRAQLERYGRLVSALHELPDVRLALYFPLHGAFRIVAD